MSSAQLIFMQSLLFTCTDRRHFLFFASCLAALPKQSLEWHHRDVALFALLTLIHLEVSRTSLHFTYTLLGSGTFRAIKQTFRLGSNGNYSSSSSSSSSTFSTCASHAQRRLCCFECRVRVTRADCDKTALASSRNELRRSTQERKTARKRQKEPERSLSRGCWLSPVRQTVKVRRERERKKWGPYRERKVISK